MIGTTLFSSNQSVEIQPYASVKLSQFRSFILYRLSNTTAFAMLDVIIGWQIYQLTKDPLSLGLIGLVEAIPFIVASLVAGYVADAFNRKRVMLVFLCLISMSVGALLVLSLGNTAARLGTLPLYVMIGVIGVAKGFLSPSSSAYMTQLIPRELYADAANISSNSWQIAAVTGPVIGGFTFGLLGASLSYAIICGMMLCAVVLVLVTRPITPQEHEEHESVLKSLIEGFRFVWRNQVILSTISLDLFAVLFGGVVALLPMFVSDVFRAGPTMLGILRAAPFVGSVLTGLALLHYPPIEKTGRKLLWAVAGFGGATILFALSTNVYLSIALLFLTGVFDSISVVIRSIIIPILTPDHIRGRVNAINNIFISTSNEIGAFESGLAAKLMTLVPSVIFGGVMTLLVVGITAFAAPKLKELELTKC